MGGEKGQSLKDHQVRGESFRTAWAPGSGRGFWRSPAWTEATGKSVRLCPTILPTSQPGTRGLLPLSRAEHVLHTTLLSLPASYQRCGFSSSVYRARLPVVLATDQVSSMHDTLQSLWMSWTLDYSQAP